MTGYSFIPIEALSPGSHSVRGIACLIAHQLQDARFNGEMTGTIEEIGSWLSIPEKELEPILDDLRLNDDLIVSRKGNRITIRSTKVRAQCERKERRKVQARLRMREFRNRKKSDASSEATRDERAEPEIPAESVTRDAGDVTRNTLANLDQEPVCAVQNRLTVYEDDNVVVVVVVSYKNKQQLQTSADGGDQPGGMPAKESTAQTAQIPFVPFPGATILPVQLVMAGLSPEMPKPQVVVDNTKSPREKEIDDLWRRLPAALQVPECRSMIEKLYDERGFGYLKAQIDYVLEMEYQGEKGFRGYLRKAVRRNFAEYAEPARPSSPAAAGNAFEKRTAAPYYESEIDRSARFMAIPILEQMEMQKDTGNSIAAQQWQEIKRAAIKQYPYCEREGYLLWAMTQMIIDHQGFRDKALISTLHKM